MRLWGFDGFSNSTGGETSSRLAAETRAFRAGDDGVEEQNPASDTVAGSISTTATISVGGAQNGYVNTVGDDDWYRIELVAGQSYAFSLTGGTLPDPYLELRNSAGGLVAIDDDFGSGHNSLLRFTPTTSGTYYVNARAFEGEGVSNTGSYTLTANTAAPASPLDSIDYHFTMPGPNIAIWFATAGFVNPSGDAATRAWTQGEINAVFAALATFSAVTPLTFTQAASQGAANWTLSLADLEDNTLGYFAPGVNGYGAFDPTVANWSAGLVPGGSSFVTLIHEFGHGLGLAHPHDNGAFDYGTNNSEIMQGVTNEFNSYGTFLMNQGVFTTMTYNDGWSFAPFGVNTSSTTGGQSTPMALDVALLQQRYGVNAATNSGATTYNLLSLASSYIAIWDVSGTDAIEFDGTAAATIDLRAATLLNAVGGGGYVSYVSGVHGGFTIANGVVIEQARGGSGDDVIIGNAAANRLVGNAGADNLSGGSGNDTLFGGAGADQLNGGPGSDFASYSSSATRVVVSLFDGAGSEGDAQGDTLTNVENVIGSSANDSLIGSDVANVLRGGAGADFISGLAGNDTLEGEDGDDRLLGDAGNDLLIGSGGADRLEGGAGSDTADYAVSTARVSVRLIDGDGLQGDALGDSFHSVENVTGGSASDSLVGSNAINLLRGADGADFLAGLAGDDTLIGDAGNDRLVGGAGADRLEGGAGSDTTDYGSSTSRVVVRLIDGDGLAGDAAGDSFHSVENATGGAASDSLVGSNAVNLLRGGAGGDFLAGLLGNDTLVGGAGNDRLVGGGGADAFVFDTALAGNIDRIDDFTAADDVIHLSTAIFNVGAGTLAAGAFTIGAAAGDANDRIIYNDATGALYYDADGNGAGAQVQFATLAPALALTNDDFFGVGP